MRRYKFPKKRNKLSKQGKAISKILSGKRVRKNPQKGGFWGAEYLMNKLAGRKPPKNNSLYQLFGK